MSVYTYMRAHVSMWRSRAYFWCLPVLLSTLFGGIGSLTEPSAHSLARRAGQATLGSSCVRALSSRVIST